MVHSALVYMHLGVHTYLVCILPWCAYCLGIHTALVCILPWFAYCLGVHTALVCIVTWCAYCLRVQAALACILPQRPVFQRADLMSLNIYSM